MSDRESATDSAMYVADAMDPGREIDTCMEWVRFRFRGLMYCLALAGFGKAGVIQGRRTFEEQVWLYGEGRSADEMAVIGVSGRYAAPEKRRVTWVDPRYSRHVKGLAIDVDLGEYPKEELYLIEEVVRQLGITWGGVWSVRDYGHFEV